MTLDKRQRWRANHRRTFTVVLNSKISRLVTAGYLAILIQLPNRVATLPA